MNSIEKLRSALQNLHDVVATYVGYAVPLTGEFAEFNQAEAAVVKAAQKAREALDTVSTKEMMDLLEIRKKLEGRKTLTTSELNWLRESLDQMIDQNGQ